MAAMRSRTHAPIGSAKWILDEREQAGQFIEQEVDEFAFSARNEFEWLNEHMSDIFSSNHFEVAEVFKTPGKLRGKTPRTTRKHTPAQNRQPLTDIFSSNTPNGVGSPKNDFYKKIVPFQVAEDKENATDQTSPKRADKSPLRQVADAENRHPSPQKAATPPLPPRSPLRPTSARKSPSPSRVMQLKQHQHESRSTGDSFVSAREALSNRQESISERLEEANNAARDGQSTADDIENVAPPPRAIIPEGLHSRNSHQYSVSTTTAAGLEHALEEVEQQSAIHDDMPVSPSDTSSPVRPIIRKKSSLTFASLPAREPFTKKSMGARASQTAEKGGSLRESVWNRQSQAQPAVAAEKPIEDENEDEDHAAPIDQPDVGSDASKLHNKTSTQRLHERITMLGKTNPQRTSKSIPSANAAAIAPAPASQALSRDPPSQATTFEEHDDDWIGPISQARNTQSTQQSAPGSFSTMSSHWTSQTQDTTLIDSQPINHHEEPEEPKQVPAHGQVAYPELKGPAPTSTTPAGSPLVARWNMDGPLSASKAKFNSFLKSAKGMFASSAATSAQAKLETLNATRSTANLPQTIQDESEEDKADAVESKDAASRNEDVRRSPALKSPGRRRSSQRLKEQKEKEKAAIAGPDSMVVDVQSNTADEMDYTEDTVSVPTNAQEQVNKSQAKPKGLASQSGELRHPNKANKGNKVLKPAHGNSKSAMSIRVPSQKPFGTFNSSVPGGSSHESKTAPSTASKAPTLTKKGSNSSLKSGSSTVNGKSTASSNARLRALDAAAKSKEREEREKQRKADEKRERERKRADAEEEKRKRVQEQKAAEQRREREEQEARAAAQKQRREREEQDRLKAEKQQAEMQRKNEALRRQAEAAKAAKVAKAEPAHVDNYQEQARPVSRAGENLGGSVRPHINPAKPKRYFQPEDDERPARPTTAQSSSYAANNNGSKRRKTSDEGAGGPSQQSTRPTMAPPVRPSMNRKPEVPSRFAHGYMASAASGQTGNSMMKSAVSNSYASNQPKTPHHMNDLAKFSNAKIPFGENANPPAGHQPSSSQHPARSMQKTPGTAHKSSPAYPNGDNIELPEIATDSEDSDDENDFVAPDWTNSPELRQLLERQQLVDPLRVFGPVAPLAMEEVFKGSKERHARFRARTSSANWSGPDRLTEEERRRDRDARERLERDGGWSYRPDL